MPFFTFYVFTFYVFTSSRPSAGRLQVVRLNKLSQGWRRAMGGLVENQRVAEPAQRQIRLVIIRDRDVQAGEVLLAVHDPLVPLFAVEVLAVPTGRLEGLVDPLRIGDGSGGDLPQELPLPRRH